MSDGHERSGMTYAEIDEALAARGVHLDLWDEMFMDGKRVLGWDEVLDILPRGSHCLFATGSAHIKFRRHCLVIEPANSSVPDHRPAIGKPCGPHSFALLPERY